MHLRNEHIKMSKAKKGLSRVTFSLLYDSDIEDVGIVCQRLDCESSDVDCVLNKTKSIQWQFIALPSIPVVQDPLVIPLKYWFFKRIKLKYLIIFQDVGVRQFHKHPTVLIYRF